MPKFKMTWPYARNWGGIALRAQPGEVIERDENPDANFFEEVDASTPVGVPSAPDAETPPATPPPPPPPAKAAAPGAPPTEPVIPAESSATPEEKK